METPAQRRRRYWYLLFSDEEGAVVGLTGPYADREKAANASRALLTAEATAMVGLALETVPASAQAIYAPYGSIRLIDLTPEEFARLGETS